MKPTVALLSLFCLWWSGCASTPKPNLTRAEASKVNWSARIGAYTFDQALADLGRPETIGESNVGKTAEWVLRRGPRVSFGFGVGGGSFRGGSGVGVGVGSTVSPPAHGENLRLVFGADGRLKAWSKVAY